MRAVIYTRYSAGPDQTVQSIEGQLRVCKEYIKKNGWDYAGYYADKHISGRTDKRPEFQAMMNAAERHEFDVLVVYSADRFSRNKFHSVSYKQQLKDLGIRVCYAAENIPEGPEGILLESLMEGWAEYYSEELSRKVKRGMTESAHKCKSLGGQRTFGYRTGPDKSWVLDEDEARAVKEVFAQVASGSTISAAARWLNESGYRTTAGGRWTHNSVKKMLTNKRYIGYYIWDGIEVPDGLPAVVDRKTFYDLQEKFKERQRPMPKNQTKYLLSGKLFCGKCGNPMTGCSGTSKSGKVYEYYRCRGRDISNISKSEIESEIVNATISLFSSDAELDQISRMLYYYLAEKNSLKREFRVPKSRLSDLKRQKENLIDVIAQTGNASLTGRLEEIEAELTRLEAQIEESKTVRTMSQEELKLALRLFFDPEQWNDPETAKERIIKSLVKEVHLFEDHIDIIFNIQIDPDDPDKGYKQTTLEGFAESESCSTINKSGRTLIIVGGYLAIEKGRS